MAAYIEDKLENQFFETTNDTQAITASQPYDKLQTSENQPLTGVEIPLKSLYENHTTPFPEPDAPSQEPPCDVAESGTRKRKRITKLDCATTQDFDPPYKAATAEEKNEWKGFCEIESDPAIFNLMLKEFGVRGVKVQEVFGLDEEMLNLLPKPVYGLIFLFRYQAEDAGEQGEDSPSNVWFANQVANNSCATVALLNMVYNVPSIQLGHELSSFKEQTALMKPARRGEKVSHFDHVRGIHNSFARKIDMMNSDALEEDEYKNRNKKGAGSKRRGSKKAAIDDSAFHFVAYMPIGQEIWRLDGLDAYPQKLGSCEPDNWLDVVVGILQHRMEGALEFNLLALIRDPLVIAVDELAYNIKFHSAIEERLDNVKSEWRHFTDKIDEEAVTGISDRDCVTEKILLRMNITEEQEKQLSKWEAADGLLELRDKNSQEQAGLRATVVGEMRVAQMDDEKAADRRNEYGPLVQRWFMMLAENGKLRELHEGLQ